MELTKVKKATLIFVILVIVAIVVYDVWAITHGGTEGTVSYLLHDWAYEYPIFTFSMGVVMGHLFWQMRKTRHTKKLEKRIAELEAQVKALQGGESG